MIERDIVIALDSIKTSMNALTLRVAACQRRKRRTLEIVALPADVEVCGIDVNYLSPIEYNELMRLAEDCDAPEEVVDADTDVETDEDMTAANVAISSLGTF